MSMSLAIRMQQDANQAYVLIIDIYQGANEACDTAINTQQGSKQACGLTAIDTHQTQLGVNQACGPMSRLQTRHMALRLIRTKVKTRHVAHS